MQLKENTILITGGGSGIGLGMAEKFRGLGNRVIVAGRTPAKLAAAKSIGCEVVSLDMGNHSSILDFAKRVPTDHPDLNFVIHNAGIMKNEDFLDPASSAIAEETVNTNLLGPIWLTRALLPHLMKKPRAVIMTVTSGLAYAPLIMTPTYCATKAAIHSFTESLRYQLKDSSIGVFELVPPYVQTALMGERQKIDVHAMPLEDFIEEVFRILVDPPASGEIVVERVRPQRSAAWGGEAKYTEFFNGLNERLLAARKDEWRKSRA